MDWTAQQDRQNMMDQLGIRALRPEPSGNEKASDHANYDERQGNPFPNLPDVFTFRNGQRVTSGPSGGGSDAKRSFEDFEREVVGRIPPGTPKVIGQ